MILIINGPNLNLLGMRDPEIYGKETLEDLSLMVRQAYPEQTFRFFQSNHEGSIIDELQTTGRLPECTGVVINPGAYAHYSYAIADALRDLPVAAVEVHISDINSREPWRRISVTAEACKGRISGRGLKGYLDAVEMLVKK
ncbi:MAG: 3-dehydroquinate dehydratase [Muribaculum sp.]|nr:3-dehydroquinate dehydratase [Muribaculum sp.]